MADTLQKPAVFHLDTVDSTSSWLRRVCAEVQLPSFSYVTARFQTGGRGQRGNSWESAAGENLMLSMIYRPATDISPRRQFSVSKTVAVALADAVEELLRPFGVHQPAEVKWPNDIYIADRKVIGILIENSIEATAGGAFRIGHTIIGVGLNLNQRTFTSPAPNPGSLIHWSRQPIDIAAAEETVARHLAGALRTLEEQIATGDCTRLDSSYRSRLWRSRGFHPYRILYPSLAPAPTAVTEQATPDIITAEIVSVADDGPITLRTADGALRTFAFKEITPVINKNLAE